MSDDLVKRLREKAKNKTNSVGDKWGDWVCDEAADRIEALEAERDVLRKWDDHFRTACGYKRDGRPSPECFDEWLAKAEAERDEERVRSHREGYSQGKSAGDAFAESIRQHVLKLEAERDSLREALVKAEADIHEIQTDGLDPYEAIDTIRSALKKDKKR